MKIKRELKTCEFIWDTETKKLEINRYIPSDNNLIEVRSDTDIQKAELNKVQMFSLARFITRIAAFSFMRRKFEKKKQEKPTKGFEEKSRENLQ